MRAFNNHMSAAAGVVVLILAIFLPVWANETPAEKLSSAAMKVREIYTSQIGIREKGTNSGKEIEAYLRYTGLPKGNPWCAAFVCWVYGQAGVENPRTAWSPSLFPSSKVIWTRKSGSVLVQLKSPPHYYTSAFSTQLATHNSQPLPADIFALYFPEKKRIAHTGFIDSWDGTWATTVEGNTNESGSREGDGVYRKRRLVSTIYKVARYIAPGKEGT